MPVFFVYLESLSSPAHDKMLFVGRKGDMALLVSPSASPVYCLVSSEMKTEMGFGILITPESSSFLSLLRLGRRIHPREELLVT